MNDNWRKSANDNDPLPFGKTAEALRNRLAHEVSKLGRLVMLAEKEHIKNKGIAVPNIGTLTVNERRLDSMYKRHTAAHQWLTDPALVQKSQKEIEVFIANLQIFIREARSYWGIPEEDINADAEIVEFPLEDKKF